MPAINITSTNTGTDEITAVAHGLLTGDRFRVRNVGGALPAATPGLAAGTDYYAVRTGGDTLKISDTNAHALAGTGIFDLTGAGSGTNTVEYGLPWCLPTASAAPLTQIKSANDQAAWSSLVALYQLLVGQAQSVFSGISIAGVINALAGVVVGANQHVVISGSALYKRGSRVRPIDASRVTWIGTAPSSVGNNGEPTFQSTAATASQLQVALDLNEGERLQQVVARVRCGATDVLAAKVFKRDESGSTVTVTQLGSTATSAGHSSLLESLAISGLTEIVGASQVSYYLEVTCTAFASSPRYCGTWLTADVP